MQMTIPDRLQAEHHSWRGLGVILGINKRKAGRDQAAGDLGEAGHKSFNTKYAKKCRREREEIRVLPVPLGV